MRNVAGYPLQAFAGDLNCVASYLALHDAPPAEPTDLLVLLGNSVIAVAERAFAAMREGAARRLLIAGGRGHATAFLEQSLQRSSRYASVLRGGCSEAELLGEVAIGHWRISPQDILLETASTNCGENAQFALRLLQERGIVAQTLILMQDPTMQRRTDASFRKIWAEARIEARFFNDPTWVPELRVRDGALAFVEPVSGCWPLERFVSLVMGEIPRLKDDPSGYGPKGRGWIAHVDIPSAALEAQARMSHFYPELVRPAR